MSSLEKQCDHRNVISYEIVELIIKPRMFVASVNVNLCCEFLANFVVILIFFRSLSSSSQFWTDDLQDGRHRVLVVTGYVRMIRRTFPPFNELSHSIEFHVEKPRIFRGIALIVRN